MKTIKTIKNVAGALLVTVTTALALTACHPDDDPGTGGTDGMITVSRLEVGIESIGSTGTRAGDAGTRAEGVYAGVKTKFVDGDVIHLYAEAAINDKFANATYTAGTWTINPALILPKNMATDAQIAALYDGKDAEYKDENAALIAQSSACIGITADENGNNPVFVTANAGDALIASNFDTSGKGGITLGANGALTIKFIHMNALIRLGKVENKLQGKKIKAVEAVVYESGNNISQYRNIPLNITGADDYTGAEAFSYVYNVMPPYVLTSFVVTINDASSNDSNGEKLIIPVPDATGTLDDEIKDSEGKPVTGQPVLSGKRYTYHLILAPGKLTATLDGNDDNLQWTDKGQLLTAPTGYIPLYNAEDLKKIGTENSGFPLDGKYILMADIDLATAANGGGDDANWTPIGKNENGKRFTGRFNGNGHTIEGMKVSTSNYASFFGAIDGAVIYNLHFEGASVASNGDYSYAGTLAGYASGCSIALCSATDCTVSGKFHSGGLVGYNSYSHFTRCYAINCTVTNNSSFSYAGGLIGTNDYSGIITSCYTAGCMVTATNEANGNGYAGGLIGLNSGNTLYGCYALYAAATATSSSNSGALAGYLSADSRSSSSVTSCYATNNTSTASNKLVSGIDGTTPPTITGCISPLNTPQEGNPTETLIDYSGVIGNGGSGTSYGITYRDGTDGYAPLVSSIADCSDVRTVIVNTTGSDVTENLGSSTTTIPPGGIYFVSRTWKAASIWKPINDGNKMNAPFIDWSYEGETK